MASHVTVGFDIGGTNMRAGVVTETGEIVESYSTSVPRTAAELEAGIVAVVEKLKQHTLSPVQAEGVDDVVRSTRFDPATGMLTVPGRTAAVLVEH